MADTSNSGFAHPMVRPGGRSERVRRAVLAAALDQMLENGYTQMTIPDIARASGVHATTIYRRWGTKGMLAVDAIAGVSTVVAPAPDTGGIEGDLGAFISSIAGALRVKAVREMVRSLAGLNEEGAADVRKAYWQARYEILEKILEQAVARGEIKTAPDTWDVLEVATAPIWMRALSTDLPINRALTQQLTERAVEFVRQNSGN